jgi:hypothetical protein
MSMGAKEVRTRRAPAGKDNRWFEMKVESRRADGDECARRVA